MLLDEAIHFLLSVLVGNIFFIASGNFWLILIALISGFLIDADHLFDYLIFKKFTGFKFNEFFSGSFFDRSGKVILPLHGYEWGLILIIIGYYLPNLNYLFWSLGTSLIIHLIYDTVSNRPIWPTYFISYRLWHHFDHQAFKFKCQR